MAWLKTAWRELLGMFIDDGSFALAIVIWLVLVKLLLGHADLLPWWQALIVFGGLAAILVESVLRRARRR